MATRKRAANFSPDEVEILTREVEKRKKLLLGKFDVNMLFAFTFYVLVECKYN